MVMRVWIFLCDLTLFPLQALPEAANSVQFQFTWSFQTDVKTPWGGGINYHRQPYLFALTWKEPGHPASLDAEGRIPVPKHRSLLPFENPAVTQVADMIQYDPEDFTGDCRPSQSGWRARRDTTAMKSHPYLIDGWAEVLGPRPTAAERQKFVGTWGVCVHFPLIFRRRHL